MKLWKPKQRITWWLAFVIAIFVLPSSLVFSGIFISQTLKAPMLYPLFILVAPLPSCYLIGVSRVNFLIKISGGALLFIGIIFMHLPSSSCSEENTDMTYSNISNSKKQNSLNCDA